VLASFALRRVRLSPRVMRIPRSSRAVFVLILTSGVLSVYGSNQHWDRTYMLLLDVVIIMLAMILMFSMAFAHAKIRSK
jgi:heme A synthase